jgi:hypothetical protein
VAEVYVFADEAGDFAFKRSAGASRYFILGTVTMADCRVGTELRDEEEVIHPGRQLLLPEPGSCAPEIGGLRPALGAIRGR